MAIVKIGNRVYDSNTTKVISAPYKQSSSTPGKGDCVQSVSVNKGDKNYPDSTGNVDLTITGISEGLANDLTATTAVGGIMSGDNFKAGTSTEEVLRKLLVKEVLPTLSITLTPVAGFKHKGDPVTLTAIGYSVSKGTASSLDSLVIKDSEELVNLTTVASGSKTVNKKYTVDTIITGTLGYTDSTGTKRTLAATAKYTFVDYNYAGPITGLPTADNISALTTSLTGALKGEVNYTTAAGQRMAYAYPASYGNVASIIDVNGYKLGAFLENTTTVTIGGIIYKVYYSNEVEVSNYKVTFN